MSTHAKLQVIAASCITDASLKPIANGNIVFLTTDAKDNPLPVSVIGTAQAVVQEVGRVVAAGSITGETLYLVNPTGDSTSPQNFRYRISITDLTTNKTTIYRNVLIQDDGNGNWNFASLNAGPVLAPHCRLQSSLAQQVPRARKALQDPMARPGPMVRSTGP